MTETPASRMERLTKIAGEIAKEFDEPVWVALYTGADATGDERHGLYYDEPDRLQYADVQKVHPDGLIELF